MSRTCGFVVLLMAGILTSLPSSSQTVPQTARQALIEMFFGKTPGTLEQHLPEVTRAALHKGTTGSGPSMFDAFSLVTSQLQARGSSLHTYEAGSTLLVLEDSQTQSKFEIVVVRDDLRGEADEIELSFKSYKNGEAQTAGVTPRLSFLMKQEKGTWRLNDVTVAIRVSLTDPQFLKSLTTKMQANTNGMSMTQPTMVGAPLAPVTHSNNEASALAGIRSIKAAETTYSAMYPNQGFTCVLADMGGMGSGATQDQHHAMMLEPRLANGRKVGYVYTLSGCDGPPASKYTVVAAPSDISGGTHTYCSDQSAVIRVIEGNDGESCLNRGTPLQ